MKRTTLVRMGSTALLAVGLALTVTMPANAAPVTSEIDAVQAALQRDLGLTPQQAEARHQQEQVAWSKDKTLRIALGSDFAGSRFDAKAGKLVVDVADASRVAEVKAAGALARVVEHSAAELTAVKSKLDKSAATPKSVTGWHIDQATNDVVVSVYGNDAAATKWANSLGADVRIQHVTERPQTFWNLIGGQAIRTSSGSRCSLGFNARNSSGPRYVITAGHCTNLGGTWSGGDVSGAQVVESDCPGADSGLLTRPNGTGPGEINTGQQITGAATPTVGEQMQKQGSTTGGGSGEVTSVDESVNFDVGVLNHEFGTTAHTDHGDSGGPAYDGEKGLGTLSGGDTVTSYFYPLTLELQAYGLELA